MVDCLVLHVTLVGKVAPIFQEEISIALAAFNLPIMGSLRPTSLAMVHFIILFMTSRVFKSHLNFIHIGVTN